MLNYRYILQYRLGREKSWYKNMSNKDIGREEHKEYWNFLLNRILDNKKCKLDRQYTANSWKGTGYRDLCFDLESYQERTAYINRDY